MSWRLEAGEKNNRVQGKDPAWFESSAWKLSCDLSRLGHGLKIESLGSHAHAFCEQIFGATLIPPLGDTSDRYSRESDLVARYEASHDRDFAIQFDYRIVESEKIDRLEVDLWVSVQTDTLESHPSVAIDFASMVGVDRLYRVDPETQSLSEFGVIERLPSKLELTHQVEKLSIAAGVRDGGIQAFYVALFLHPTDQEDASWSRTTHGDPKRIAHDGLRIKLFGDFMEKGVIRRARIRFSVSTSPMTNATLEEAYRKFAWSPPPLDT